ncbi:MAG: hypothetical protein AAF443_04260 [Chlamydiota bacterium]
MPKLEPGIQKIEGKKGAYYRAQIRIKGYKSLSKNFEKYREAKDWRLKTREAMKSGKPYETTEMRHTTLASLIDRFIASELDQTSSNYATRLGQLEWWKQEIGHCILTRLSENLICLCRDKLLKTKDQFGVPVQIGISLTKSPSDILFCPL